MEPIEVVAKFRCDSYSATADGTRTYRLYAVTDEVNKQWAKYTPGGSLDITINNPDAQIFEPGHNYFLRFSAAKEGERFPTP